MAFQTSSSEIDKESLPVITMHELSLHNKADDLWVCVNEIVFDVTNFDHRPGQSMILKAAGSDITASFNRFHAYVNCARCPGVKVVGRIEKDKNSHSSSATAKFLPKSYQMSSTKKSEPKRKTLPIISQPSSSK
ncbi:putative cytochrome-b5 reductase [Monocercomonoides exilis]|uniref:putative cytochrome-b5 reductase n=1 Tax=Monocercomonoides exilis TaxID=2049356 RepID=UPI003559C7A5|nr:putative cytochrome-b5 reductase [Monocercomonoides exilis]